MTAQALEALAPRELDAKVIKDVMQWEPDHYTEIGHEVWWLNKEGRPMQHPRWSPSTDDNAIRLVRNRISELGLYRKYQEWLSLQVWPADRAKAEFQGSAHFAFMLQQATPRQQAIAAILATGGE